MNRPEQNTQSVPISFFNRLSENEAAHTCYASLSTADKRKIVSYIQVSTTGEEARAHTEQIISDLSRRTPEGAGPMS